MKDLELTEDEQRMPRETGFFHRAEAQPHEVPRVVLIDAAGIPKGEPLDKKRRQ